MGIHEDAEKIRREIEENKKEKLKIALFGQPGSGKSSIINKLVGKEVVKTGASTDVTVEAQIVEYGDLLLVDLPGYGTSKFPPNDWITEFEPDNFNLFICVFSGKFHEADTTFFRQLKEKGRVCLFVRNMSDQIWEEGKSREQLEQIIMEDVQKQVGSYEKVYFTSCRKNEGFAELQEGILKALDPAKREQYAKSAASYTKKHLRLKKEACQKIVTKYAAISAAGSATPIPGTSVAVDLGVLLGLFKEIRESYGLTDQKLDNLAPHLLPLTNNVVKFATQDGLKLLLKQFASQEAGKEFAKYVPFVGPIIAAAIGFAITRTAGNSYLEDCHRLAEAILNEQVKAA